MDFLKFMFLETLRVCVGLYGLLCIVVICQEIEELFKRMVKFCANRIAAIRKVKTVYK